MQRREWMLCAAGAFCARAGEAADDSLSFPRDFGSHPQSRIEWWYATGWLTADDEPDDAAPRHGFQITFFRSRTDLAASNPSRFAARELVFAHAAVSDLAGRRLRHDQRIARSGFDIAQAALDDARVRLRDWQLARTGPADASRYAVRAASEAGGFGFELQLQTTQPVLLQGEAGLSRKGPNPAQTSRYYSQPQLAVRGTLRLDGRAQAVRGRAWLDHEWSDALLDPRAVGWDWIGINLASGAALTAFRVRRADTTALHAGGSWREAGAATARNFGSDEVVLRPGRVWTSAATRAVYPVEWDIATPAGRYRVRALLDAQELDSRPSTGAVYWEGLSELLDERGARLGLGYLEMTGYVAPLRL